MGVMPGADVAVSCLVLAHGGNPDAVLENGFADGQWCEECAHVVIIKGLCKEKTPPLLTGFFAVLNLGLHLFDVEVQG